MQRRDAFLRAFRRGNARARIQAAPLALALLLILLPAALSGCGPIEYINQVTRKASSEVDAARAVKADKHAPYWYTLAVEYLAKAREEAAAADFQSANLFGRRSAKAARKARSIAIERARDPEAAAEADEPEDDIEIVDPDDPTITDPTSEEALKQDDDNPLAGQGDDESESR